MNVRAEAVDEVRDLILPFHFCCYFSFSAAQRIAFNREQRMFKVSMTGYLPTSVRREQDVMGASKW